MNLPNTLFFDIDGTLLDTNTHEIPHSAILALNKLADQGYAICIASGRDQYMFSQLHLEHVVKWKFVILSNGHVILDENFKVIRQHFVNPETIHTLIKRAKEHHIPVFCGGPQGDMLSQEPNDYVKTSHAYYQEPIPKVKLYENEPIDKIALYEKVGFDWRIFDDIDDLDIKATMTTSADVMSAGVSKHSSILDVLSTYGYSDYYIAFGDSFNDYEMLQHAPISVAMGNAVEPLKKIAHYVTEDVDHDGIAKILSRLGYLVD